MNRSHNDGKSTPASNALREAGYLPLPRLWIKAEDMPKIHNIAFPYSKEVHAIRGRVKKEQSWDQAVPQQQAVEESVEQSVQEPANILNDRDAAWAHWERMGT